jgi:hypothetical protein
VAKFCPTTHRLLAYTAPFFFLDDAVEYCLSLGTVDDDFVTVVSRYDADPTLVRLDFDRLDFRDL